MSGYEDAPEISFGDDALTAEQCFARARRALEQAELDLRNLERGYPTGDLEDHMALRIVEERSYIGHAWAELGAAMRRAER